MNTKKKDNEYLNSNIIRNLNDKLYEKRRIAALEIEKIVREYQSLEETDKIELILIYLNDNFIRSLSSSSRKGGLIGLAAVAIGLGNDVFIYLGYLILPVLSCFVDSDIKVRYYACEAAYNIAKVSRGHILLYLDEIFDNLLKVVADSDSSVRNAAEIFDSLLKDLVTEGHRFDFPNLISVISRRIILQNTECRIFILDWIKVLDSIPELEFFKYLPMFLSELFKMFSDSSREFREKLTSDLSELLSQLINNSYNVDMGKVISILASNCDTNQRTGIDDGCTIKNYMAETWILKFIDSLKNRITEYIPMILEHILPCISHKNSRVKKLAQDINESLLEIVRTTDEKYDLKSILSALQANFDREKEAKLALLDWFCYLNDTIHSDLSEFQPTLFCDLIKLMSVATGFEEVAHVLLPLVAKMSNHEDNFNILITNLISLFKSDKKALESRGNLIIRTFSLHISPEKIYRAFAEKLQNEKNLDFCSKMIQTLNLILLTSKELYELRNSLKNITPETNELFICLYKSWCHNPASLLSLCLLAQVYEHSSELIYKFADLEMSVSFFVEIDKLIQLLESYAFTYLRLQLLEPEKYPYLFKTLYGILMILPQSETYTLLKNRLSVITPSVLSLVPQNKSDPTEKNFYQELLVYFQTVQNKYPRKNIN